MGTLVSDDQISVAGSEKRSKTNYKKYGLKEYKNLQNTLQNTKMGGLGAILDRLSGKLPNVKRRWQTSMPRI